MKRNPTFPKLTSKEAGTLIEMLPDYEIGETVPACNLVGKPNGDQYSVDTKTRICTCPDFKYRGGPCKHLIFADYVLGYEGPVDLDWIEKIAGLDL